MLTFILWAAAGCIFIGIGVFCFRAKRAMGFWANAKVMEVRDVKAYNRAMGKMWCGFGGLFILLGLPLLSGQNAPGVLITILGSVFLILAVAVIYSQIIEPKYKK